MQEYEAYGKSLALYDLADIIDSKLDCLND